MNNEKNSSNEKRNDASASTIRNDASSKDASSGKSSSGREPQQGSPIDNRSNTRGNSPDPSGAGSHSKR